MLYETLAARSEDAVGSQVKVDNDDANSEGDSDEEIEGASGKRKKGEYNRFSRKENPRGWVARSTKCSDSVLC